MKKIPDDAIVRLIDLPHGIGGAVMEDEDGFVSIYVNSRHGHYAQLDDLDHEITHVINDDLHNDDPIEVIEARADQKPSPLGKLAQPQAVTDEVGSLSSLRNLPRLMKARDLLPPSKSLPPQSGFAHASRARDGKVASAKQMTEEVPRSPVPLTPRQSSVLRNALSDLDAFLFTPSDYDF